LSFSICETYSTLYPTNAIENFNRQLRKVTKTKSAFVSDDALMKILYLATTNITEKWTMPVRNWGTILDHLMIFFGDRVPVTL
jgi:putative transposase